MSEVVKVITPNGAVYRPYLGAVIVSPDGTKWRITISNDGVLTPEKIITEVPATGISLSASVLSFNDSANQTIKASLTPADSTDAVIWETSNPDVATVSNGVVTPIGNGSCTITATAGSVSASCAVTVDVAVVETYSITRNITNATGFDDSTVIGEGSELLECYISNDECTMDGATATVTMGGEDITETAWDNGVVNIAEVTGDVVITLTAVQIQYVVPPIEDFAVDPHTSYTLLTAYNGSETAIEIPESGLVDGVETTFKFMTFSAGSAKHVKVPETLQYYSGSGKFVISGTNLVTISGNGGNYSYPPAQNAVWEKPFSTGGTSYKRCYAIRTLQGVTYPETVTSFSALYQQCTSLVHGGTVPAQVTNLKNAFYGCEQLRKIRLEAKEVSDTTNAFYGTSNLEMELYSDSNYWNSIRGTVATPSGNTYKFIDDVVFNPILCIGDSLTSDSYPDSLISLVPTNARVYRSSQGGYTSQQIYDSKMLTDSVKPWLSKSIVVIWHGTNGYGTDGYDGITAKMVEALDGNQRYVLIPPTAQGVGDEVYESWVATYGAEHVMSVGDWFANNGYTVSDYQTDGTHFTEDGYALVAQAVYEKISQWL